MKCIDGYKKTKHHGAAGKMKPCYLLMLSQIKRINLSTLCSEY